MIRTDYLVVGAGASGLAFADAVLAEADVEVTVIDRREAPGGPWVDAYPFVRLHSPSEDWPRMISRTWRTEGKWLGEPDLSAWVSRSRLNLLQALPDHTSEPPVQSAITRFLTHVRAATERRGGWTNRAHQEVKMAPRSARDFWGQADGPT